ncbi:MAG: hypothetical protein ACK4UN_16815 [Limisphaerales bacterium]
MKEKRRAQAIFAVGSLLLAPLLALAVAGTTQVGWKGKPVEARAGWPKGALDLINDPLRMEGWHRWFSGIFNPVDDFEFEVRNMDEVNHLLELLGKIDSPGLQVRLDPAGSLPPGLQQSKSNKKVGMVLSIGDQEQLDQWQRELARAEREKTGGELQEKTQDPLPHPNQQALAPTFTLYAGHEAINLTQARFPENVEVISNVTQSYRRGQPDDPTWREIDQAMKKLAESRGRAANRLPELTSAQRNLLASEAQQAFTRFVRRDPHTRGHVIPQELWGPTIAALNPLRVVEDRVNIVLVMADNGKEESGFYISLVISSFIRPRTDFIEFTSLSEPGDKTFGSISRYRARSGFTEAQSEEK